MAAYKHWLIEFRFWLLQVSPVTLNLVREYFVRCANRAEFSELPNTILRVEPRNRLRAHLLSRSVADLQCGLQASNGLHLGKCSLVRLTPFLGTATFAGNIHLHDGALCNTSIHTRFEAYTPVGCAGCRSLVLQIYNARHWCGSI